MSKLRQSGVPDNVEHPSHYTAHPSGIECIAITEHFNFNIGNAIKYLWRAGRKGDQVEDLRKAAWYINREIERVSTDNQTAPPCVETDGFSSAIAQPPASSDGSGEGRPLDGTRPDTKGEATGGRGHFLDSRNAKQEPVAWMVKEDAEFCAAHFLFTDEERAQKFAKIQNGLTVVPLYRTPQSCPYVVGRTTLHCSLTPLTLTAEEREAIHWAIISGCNRYGQDATLRSLLDRTKVVEK